MPRLAPLVATLFGLACAATGPAPEGDGVGTRVEGCDDECTADETRCSGIEVQKCEADASGCRRWAVSVACTDGQECRNGSCGAACSECAPGEQRPVEGQPHAFQACVARADGCRAWDTAVKKCPGERVVDDGGTCIDCKASDVCPADELCASPGCYPVLGATYDLHVVSGVLDASLESWTDTPDAYVVVLVDGVEVGRTKSVDKSLRPVWNEKLKVELKPSTAAFGLRVYDEESLSSDTLLAEVLCVDDCLLQTFRAGGADGPIDDDGKVKVTYTLTRSPSP
ncbi:MAG: hypothetical protein RL199_827 [Pseudomonadota bacterium]|jgi:hypothetical protein